MPISSPSYFPPQRATDRIVGLNAGFSQLGQRVFLAGQDAGNFSDVNDVIVIGHEAFSKTVLDHNYDGSIIIGSAAYSVNTPLVGTYTGALTLIGFNAGQNLLPNASGNVIIGDGALQNNNLNTNTSDCSGNVVIGSNAVNLIGGPGGNTGIQGTVAIGYSVLSAPGTPIAELVDCVFMGRNCGANTSNNSTGSVCIGVNANLGGGTQDHSVVIGASAQSQGTQGIAIGQSAGAFSAGAVCVGRGASAGVGGTATNAVVIGFLAQSGSAVNALDSIAIGNGASVNGNNSIAIGNAASTAGTQQIVIGATTLVATTANLLLIGSTVGNALYGSMATGAFAIGGASVTLPTLLGTNTLMLFAGTKGGSNPVGGGYFYVTGANNDLHWVDSAGNDTTLAFAQGQLAATVGAGYTNNAAAQAGTLTNAPTAGNPTRWIPINDNGTIRNVPAW